MIGGISFTRGGGVGGGGGGQVTGNEHIDIP